MPSGEAPEGGQESEIKLSDPKVNPEEEFKTQTRSKFKSETPSCQIQDEFQGQSPSYRPSQVQGLVKYQVIRSKGKSRKPDSSNRSKQGESENGKPRWEVQSGLGSVRI